MRRFAAPLSAVAALALGARTGYRLLANGALTVDLGIGRRLQPLGPLAQTIAAPPEAVFGVIAAAYLDRTPRALGKLQVRQRGSDMVLAAAAGALGERVDKWRRNLDHESRSMAPGSVGDACTKRPALPDDPKPVDAITRAMQLEIALADLRDLRAATQSDVAEVLKDPAPRLSIATSRRSAAGWSATRSMPESIIRGRERFGALLDHCGLGVTDVDIDRA